MDCSASILRLKISCCLAGIYYEAQHSNKKLGPITAHDNLNHIEDLEHYGTKIYEDQGDLG